MAVINPANPIRRIGSGGNGASAYEVAVENGFNGTEQEWLQSLVGPEGKQGDPGPIGPIGPIGPTGETGEQGLDGKSAYDIAVENGFGGNEAEWLQTLIGPEGRQGDPGETGDTGPIGPAGADGKSAYEIAVENGFEGDEISWLASLKGADGADGAPGEQGPQGIPGVDGPQGIQGEQGPPFAITKIYASIDEMNADFGSSDVAIGQFVLINTGNVEDEDNAKLFVKTPIKFAFITDLSGAQGIQGPQGIQGIQGQQGEQGEQGIQGPAGANGQNGTDGVSPTVSVTVITGGHQVSVTDADGTHTFDVMDGTSVDAIDRCAWLYEAGSDLSVFTSGNTNVASFSEFIGHTPKASTNNVGLILVNSKLYWSKFDITAVNEDSQSVTQLFTQDPIPVGSSDTEELITIKDTAVTSIDQIPSEKLPCCFHLVNAEFGFLFNDDVVYVKSAGDILWVYTIDGSIAEMNVASNGGLSVNRVRYVATKDYVDSKIAEINTSGGTTTIVSGGGLVTQQVTLLASGWDENHEQTVTVNGVTSNDLEQLITTIPSNASFTDYYTADIKSIAYSDNSITFRYYDEQPTVDCVVNVFIENVDGSEEDNGAYIWWSPEMTSDTAPSPYVASSSDPLVESGKTYNAYMAFDNVSTDRNNCWVSNVSDKWLQFDFGKSVKVNGIAICPAYGAVVNTDCFSPKTFSIYAGNSENALIKILDVNSAVAPPADIYKEYMFPEAGSYRYIRIADCGENYVTGSFKNRTCFSDIRFHIKESEVTSV